MKTKISSTIFIILCWAVAALFIFAGVGKIQNPSEFVQHIDNYRLLPYILVTITGLILPWLEVICAIFLLFGFWRQGASLLLFLLSLLFLFVISSALIRGLDITCGCFALNEETTKISYLKLLENLILVVFTFFIYVKSTNTAKEIP